MGLHQTQFPRPANMLRSDKGIPKTLRKPLEGSRRATFQLAKSISEANAFEELDARDFCFHTQQRKLWQLDPR